MTLPGRTPAQLRSMFGANLRTLSSNYSSVSALSRDLGINRTQYNRYLSGESFPRPDVLARICDFFSVDARVLLEPVEQIPSHQGPIASPFLSGFAGRAAQHVTEDDFPSGFYQFSRRSFVKEAEFVRGLVHVKRDGANTFVRGYEPKTAMATQGIPPTPSAREYRGFVLKLDDGLSITASRRNGITASLNFLNRVASFENNFWVGYVARTVRENPTSDRMTRLVYEYVGQSPSAALATGRRAGFCNFDDLIPFHQRLLQPDAPFR